ncbi:MAG: UbiA family prenyltransferase [Bacteroidia bacterium]
MAWIKVLHRTNLLMVLLVLLSIRYCLQAPVFESLEMNFVLSTLEFGLLCLSCLLIASGGSLITAYYSEKADRINKPNYKIEHPESLIRWYMVLSLTGIALAIYVGWRAHLMNLAIIQVIASFLMWKYAEVWREKPLFGHLILSSLMAFVVFVPLLYEYIAMSVLYRESAQAARQLLTVSLFYALFIYLAILQRELIKSVQYITGQAAAGYYTLALRYGIPFTKKLSLILMGVLLALVGVVVLLQLSRLAWWPATYLILAVVLPGTVALRKLSQAFAPYEFGQIRKQLFWLHLGGVLSLAFFYLEILIF